jgi:2-polyprenyl-3-methyl-5-hydroxy-6-metoxy-1,4-benzoquinol methylase
MKADVSRRHPGPELMDRNDIPEEDLFQNYRELHKVNSLLGGYRITLKGLSQFIPATGSLSVLDVGCGGGDTLKTIAIWGRKKQMSLQLTGVDLSEAAIKYSKENCKSFSEIEFIRDDVFHHLAS